MEYKCLKCKEEITQGNEMGNNQICLDCAEEIVNNWVCEYLKELKGDK